MHDNLDATEATLHPEAKVNTESTENQEAEWTDKDFIPGLEEFEDPEDAQKLVELAKELNVEMEELIRVYEYKLLLVDQLDVQPTLTEVPSANVPDVKHIAQLIRVAQSDTALDDAVANGVDLEALGQFDELTSTKGKIMRRFGKKRETQIAHSKVQEEARKIVIQEMYRLVQNTRDLGEDFPETVVNEAKFRNATTEEGAKQSAEQLQSDAHTLSDIEARIDRHKAIATELRALHNVESIPFVKGRLAEVERTIEGLRNRLENSRSRIAELKDNKQVGIAHQMLVRRNQFREAVDDEFSIEEQRGLTSREYVDEIDKFNIQLQAFKERHPNKFGDTNPLFTKLRYNRFQIEEGRNISNGRLYTHTAFDSKMFNILREGFILSSAAMEAHGVDSWSQRTFKSDLEKHEICFEVNSVYHEVAADKTGASDANIAIVLSENALIAEGGQYAEHDGIHAFHPDFQSDDPSSPGLEVDLTQTPFMLLVNERAREKFLHFIRTESAWATQLQSMDESEFQTWLDNNVEFTKHLSEWRAEPDTIDRFHQRNGIVPKKGRVHLSSNRPEMKSGSKLPIYTFKQAA